MKKRTFIALGVHIVLAAALSVYLVFFHVDSSVQELMDSDTRIVIDSQEKFDEAIKTDGRIYALGKIRGTINVSDISLDDLVFRGNDKEKKVQKIKSYLNGDYVYIDFFSERLSEKTVIERDTLREGKYERKYEIVREPYAHLELYDTFSFYGYVFTNTEDLMHSFYNQMKSTLIKGKMESTFIKRKAEEHVISAKYIPDEQPMWLEFTVTKGQIDMDSVGIHSTTGSFNYTARAAAGDISPLSTVFGVFLVAAISFGLTVAILSNF